jgi:lipopolysaccharide heptosyltransferase II
MTQPDNGGSAGTPILLIPYMWIGDFVRCHSVVKVLRERWPDRPVDMLATTLCAPLADYMPGLRRAVIVDLPRQRLAFSQHKALAERLRPEGYGDAIVMPRTWKSALAPYLAGIPRRTGWAGEARFVLVNDMRWGERQRPRMIDQCAALALPHETRQPAEWPLPELRVPPADITAWRQRMGLPDDTRLAVGLCPGAVGPSKRWTVAGYRALADRLGRDGLAVWVFGGPGERELAQEIAQAGTHVRDLTGDDLRNAILGLAGAQVAVSNDSGLLHVAAAAGTPAIGIFGPTSAKLWAPLNPLAAVIETATELPCRPCHRPVCRLEHHRCMRDIAPEQVVTATLRALNAAA